MNGLHRTSIHRGLNGPAGRWTLRAKDIVSSKEAETVFHLRQIGSNDKGTIGNPPHGGLGTVVSGMDGKLTHTELDCCMQNGYLLLKDALTGDEVRQFLALTDRDRTDTSYFWRDAGLGIHQSLNCDSLISSPEIDQLIRHPRLMSYVDD